ncbi:MAG: PLP-dependent aminotransferase family protein [Janthinobacterium lividum]
MSETVTQRLRSLAEAGAPGERLPSVRTLMRDWQVSPVTVQRALDTLGREGVLEARPGHGTFVAPREAPTDEVADYGWQSLALGPARDVTNGLDASWRLQVGEARQLQMGYLPPTLQPGALLAAAAQRALRRPGVWDRAPHAGYEALRAWFAAGIGGGFTARDVTVCPGSQAAIATAFRGLARSGDPVLMESPTYFGAIAAARAAGLRPVPVPTDAEGVRPDLLDEAFKRSGARLFFCQPTFSNPTGSVLPADRRDAVLAIAASHHAFVVEDDWARDFALDGEPPPPLAAADRQGHVVYIRSLTKSAAPGLRIGALCARGPAGDRLRAARLVDDFFVPGLLQETALQLVTAAAWPKHLRSLRAALRRNRDLLAATLRAQLGPHSRFIEPLGGLHLWLRLPEGQSDLEVATAAQTAGVLVTPGFHAFPAEPPGGFLRLSYTMVDASWVDAAARVIADIIVSPAS